MYSRCKAGARQAKDVATLELFRTLRRLVVDGGRLSVADNVALTQVILSPRPPHLSFSRVGGVGATSPSHRRPAAPFSVTKLCLTSV